MKLLLIATALAVSTSTFAAEPNLPVEPPFVMSFESTESMNVRYAAMREAELKKIYAPRTNKKSVSRSDAWLRCDGDKTCQQATLRVAPIGPGGELSKPGSKENDAMYLATLRYFEVADEVKAVRARQRLDDAISDLEALNARSDAQLRAASAPESDTARRIRQRAYEPRYPLRYRCARIGC